MVAIPLYVKHNIFFREGGAGRFDVSVSPKQTMGKTVCTFLLNFYSSIFLTKSYFENGSPVAKWSRVLIFHYRA